MISKKLKTLFLISIFLFIFHGLEEYFTKFYDVYPLLNFQWTNRLFESIPQATFLTFQVMWWFTLLVSYVLLRRDRGTLVFMTFLGLIYIYEATHILSAIVTQSYTPGLFSAPFLPLIGFFYWKERVKHWGKNYGR